MPDASSILAYAIGGLIGLALYATAAFLRRGARVTGRPVGVALIGSFQIAAGLFFSVILIFLLQAAIGRYEELRVELRPKGFTPEALITMVLVMGSLGLVGGVGLWRGRSLGWRVTVFVLACGIARNALALLVSRDAIRVLGQTEGFYYGQHLARAAVGLTAVAYLYRTAVLEYCDISLSHAAHVRALVISVTLAIVEEMIVLRLNR